MNKLKGTRAGCAAVLLALFAVQLTMHLNADNLQLDDWVFFAALDGGQSLLGYLAQRWQTWSSRLIIEGLLTGLTHSIWLWRVCDSAMMVLLAYGLCRLANAERRPGMLALSACMVTAIPFAILRSTGWMATSLNYYWPLACVAGALIPLADALWGRATGRGWMIAAPLCALLGANQEQTAALLVGAHIVLGAALLLRERRVRPILAVILAIALAELAAHLLCPGNGVRAAQSVAEVNLRDYAQFSLVDKLSICLTSTTALLFFTPNSLLLACGACVLAAVIARRRGAGSACLTALPLGFALLAQLIMRQVLPHLGAGHTPLEAFGRYGSYVLQLGPERIGLPGQMGMMAAVIGLLGLMALSAYLAVGHRPLAAGAAFCFALGFAARMALAFSPTVVESGERTMLPLYGAMMLLALLCLRDVRAEGGRRWPGAAAFALCAYLAAANFMASFALAA